MDDLETMKLKAKAKAKAMRMRQGQDTRTLRERIPETKVGKFFGNVEQALGQVKEKALPFPLNLTPVGMTLSTMQAMAGGGKKIANAFQPNVTPSGTPQRTLEAVGRGGEVLTGVAQIAGSPIAGIPLMGEAIDYPMDWAIRNQPQYKQFQQITNAFGVPDVAETAKDVIKIPMSIALAEGAGGAIRSGGAKLKARSLKKATKEIKQAIPPKSSELNYDEMWDRAKPYIAEEQRTNPAFKNKDYVSQIRSASDAISNARQKIWDKSYKQIQKHKNILINQRPIAEQIRATIDENMYLHEPVKAQALENFAKTFENDVPLAQAYDYVRQLNAKTKSFQKASPEGQAMMLSNDPMLEAKVTVLDALRENIFNRLEEFGEKGLGKMRKDYGALTFMKQAVDRNIVRAEKQSGNLSILGRFSSPAGTMFATEAMGMGLAKYPKSTMLGITAGALRDYVLHRNLANPTIERVFNRLAKSDLTPPVYPEATPPTIRGFLPPAFNRTMEGQPVPKEFTSQPYPPTVGIPEPLNWMPEGQRLLRGTTTTEIPYSLKKVITDELGLPINTPDWKIYDYIKTLNFKK